MFIHRSVHLAICVAGECVFLHNYLGILSRENETEEERESEYMIDLYRFMIVNAVELIQPSGFSTAELHDSTTRRHGIPASWDSRHRKSRGCQVMILGVVGLF